MSTDKYMIKKLGDFIIITDTSGHTTYHTQLEDWRLTLNLINYLAPSKKKGILFLTMYAKLTNTHAKVLYEAGKQFVTQN